MISLERLKDARVSKIGVKRMPRAILELMRVLRSSHGQSGKQSHNSSVRAHGMVMHHLLVMA